MENYLLCDNCGHKNDITSERIVFCKGCHKKLTNNYLDWKKSKFNSSFETYINDLNTYNQSVPEKVIIEEIKEPSGTGFKAPFSKKAIIFISSIVIQIIAFLAIMQNEPTCSATAGGILKIEQPNDYIQDVKWGTYSITQTLSLSLPFELKKSSSVFPYTMNYFVESITSQKSESPNSFSVTIEKATFIPEFKSRDNHLIAVGDDYMNNPGVYPEKDEGLHMMIQGYKTYVEHGSYTMNGNEYLYENYTLTKGNEGVKIILSYLKNDLLLRKYADIVTQSLMKNNYTI